MNGASKAQTVVPLIIAFGKKVGLEQAKAIVQRNNEEASRDYGRRCGAAMGSNTMADPAREIASWGEGGVLEEEVLELDERTYAFNVTGFFYVERYVTRLWAFESLATVFPAAG